MKTSVVLAALFASSLLLFPFPQALACADEAWEQEFDDDQLTMDDLEQLYINSLKDETS